MAITTSYRVDCVFPLNMPNSIKREIDRVAIPSWDERSDGQIASCYRTSTGTARAIDRQWAAIAKRMQRMKLYHYYRWFREPHAPDKNYRIWARSQREATGLYQREVESGKLSLALSGAASDAHKYYEVGGTMCVFIQQVDPINYVRIAHDKELS